MTIEIHQPELEALIQQRMSSEQSFDIEEVLLRALTSDARKDAARPFVKRNNLDEVFAKVRGLADDVDFSRDPSPGREIDLS